MNAKRTLIGDTLAWVFLPPKESRQQCFSAEYAVFICIHMLMRCLKDSQLHRTPQLPKKKNYTDIYIHVYINRYYEIYKKCIQTSNVV